MAIIPVFASGFFIETGKFLSELIVFTSFLSANDYEHSRKLIAIIAGPASA
jgi:hypothetical protein